MSSHVVALAGPRGCGKSTIAQHLVEQHGFERLAFSDVLREIAMLAGPERVNDRQYLSDLGQVLRSYDPRFLLKAMEEKLNQGTKIVIEDIRFPQELAFCRTQGIFTVYLDLDETEQLQRIQEREGCSPEVARERQSPTITFSIEPPLGTKSSRRKEIFETLLARLFQ